MKVPKERSEDNTRRKMPRHQTDVVRCALGEVINLSGTGMRIAVSGRCRIKIGQVVPIKLKTPSGMMVLSARAVWRRRTGLLGGHQVGFNFDSITPQQSVALGTIARFGFVAGSEVVSDTPSNTASPAQVEASIVLAEYYKRLGLEPSASGDEIKAAYRQLARKYHPDVAPGEENRQKFMELREAYDLINDHLRRAS